MKNTIQVAVGIVIDRNKRTVVVAKRKADQHLGGLWEFPGGKVEAGETPLQALKRELDEEIGITVNKARLFLQKQHDYSEKSVCLYFYLVSDFSGTPRGKENQMVKEVALEALAQLDMPKANDEIINQLTQETFFREEPLYPEINN